MEQPRIERVFRLMSLMTGKVSYSIDELAEKLDTSYRSIYRYIDTLKTIGFVIEKNSHNVYKLVEMPKEYKSLQNLVLFSDEEAKIVCSMIEGLDSTNTMKAALYKKLAAIYDVSKINEFEGSKSNANSVAVLGKAIEDHKRVILHDYASANSGQIRDRLVEPFAFTNNHIDIWAYDCEKKANRIFKIPRIGKAELLTDGWEYESEHHKQMIDAFHMCGDDSIHVRLELNLLARNLLIEEFPLAVSDVTAEGDHWVFDSHVCKVEGIGRFVMGLLNEVKIIDSPELENYIGNCITKYNNR